MSEPFLIPKPKRAARWFRRALIPAFLLTLVIPGTREVHWMSARILVPAWQGAVVVRGQPPGCTIYEIPNTTFREGVSFEELGFSADSPDAVLVSLLGDIALPPADLGQIPAAWSDHPALIWTALNLVARQPSEMPPDRPRSPSWREPEPIFALIELAQLAEPNNGALWLAEADLHFQCGSDKAGLDALQIAADRTDWNCGLESVFRYAADRLHGLGHNELDAANDAPRYHFDRPSVGLRRSLNQIVTQAAADGDHAAVAHIMDIWASLMCCEWRHASHLNRFQIPSFDDELICAISESHPDLTGLSFSGLGPPPYVGNDLMRHYLQTAGFRETAARFNECVKTTFKDLIPRPDPRLFDWWFKSSLFGFSSYYLLAMIMTAGLVGIPFRALMRPDALGIPRPGGLPFWGAILAAMALSAYVLWNAVTSNYPWPGFGPAIPIKKELAWQRECFAFVALWITCTFLLHWLTARRAWICRGLVAAGCVAYFVSVCATAYSRHALAVLLENGVFG